MSQNADILSHLQSGWTLTPLEALNQFGCFRLAARVWELRGQGYDISSEYIEVNGKSVAQYSMVSH